MEEQQEQLEQKERVGMASRFRFVNGEAEKVVPGHAENDEEEQEGEEEEEEEEELDVGDDDAAGEGVGDGDWGDAEAFLAGLEDGMMRDGEDVGDDPTDPEPLGEGERRKRKRAEDLDGGHFSWNSQDTG